MHISCASKTKNRANITELDSRNFESHYFEQKITLTYQFRIEGMKTEAKRVYKKKELSESKEFAIITYAH